MKILKLKAENIKKLIAIEIEPTGAVVKITGKNGQGKTSVLDSIWWALGGTENIQAQPIRQGEKKAKVEIFFEDMVVSRTFTEAGTTLTITNKEGLKYPSPQTMLDNLLGKLTFDPLEFMRMDPKKQLETLRQLTGVDVTDLDTKRQELFDQRTSVNREAKSLKSRFDAVVVPPGAPDNETPSTELMAKINEATSAIRARDSIASRDQALASANDQSRKRIEAIKAQIAGLTNEMEGLQVTIEENEKLRAGLKDRLKEPVPDLKALQDELAGLDTKNAAARKKKEKSDLHAQLVAKEKEADTLSEAIVVVDGEKQARIKAAKFPLPDLGFGDGVVTYRNLPLDQASSAEQLRVSMAMAMALNPKLRVIRITDGSLLDSGSMKIVEEMASAGDFQVWMEAVDESGKVGIVIEEGQVKSVNAA